MRIVTYDSDSIFWTKTHIVYNEYKTMQAIRLKTFVGIN